MLRSGAQGSALIVLLSAILSVVCVSKLSFLTTAEKQLQDKISTPALGSLPQSSDLVIVEINDQTLSQFPYREPVDRKFLSDLLTNVAEDKPRAILLDVLFDVPTEPAKDEELRSIIAGFQIPLVISFTDAPEIVNAEQLRYESDFVPLADRGLPELGEDDDGVTRSFGPGRKMNDGTFLPSAPYLLLEKLGMKPDPAWKTIAWRGSPLGEQHPFLAIPAQALPAAPPDWLAGKIVVIGGNLSLTDRHITPIDRDMPGSTVLAHVIDQLAANRQPAASGFLIDLLSAIAAASIGVAIAFSGWRLKYRLASGLLFPVLLLAIAFGVSAAAHVLIGVISAAMAFIGAMWAGEAVRGSSRVDS
jgi:CHASE2 domain-containing sensor protein